MWQGITPLDYCSTDILLNELNHVHLDSLVLAHRSETSPSLSLLRRGTCFYKSLLGKEEVPQAVRLINVGKTPVLNL